MRRLSVLPNLFTLGNGICGTIAILYIGHYAVSATNGAGNGHFHSLVIAAWLIFLGMIFDGIDGKIARMTDSTSDFGAQLDSLCDIITFGAAPAVLMLRTLTTILRGQIERIDMMLGGMAMERTIWCIAAAYFACAALRLARFNVESESDEGGHMTFRGLPSPGAASAVAAMVLLFAFLAESERGWRSSTWILATVSITLPVVTLVVALLMVSSFDYTHIVNHYLGGRRGFGFLVKLLVCILAAIWQFYITAAALAVAYTFSGPLRALGKKVRRKSIQEATAK